VEALACEPFQAVLQVVPALHVGSVGFQPLNVLAQRSDGSVTEDTRDGHKARKMLHGYGIRGELKFISKNKIQNYFINYEFFCCII